MNKPRPLLANALEARIPHDRFDFVDLRHHLDFARDDDEDSPSATDARKLSERDSAQFVLTCCHPSSTNGASPPPAASTMTANWRQIARGRCGTTGSSVSGPASSKQPSAIRCLFVARGAESPR